jgi:hypothetical protein
VVLGCLPILLMLFDGTSMVVERVKPNGPTIATTPVLAYLSF